MKKNTAHLVKLTLATIVIAACVLPTLRFIKYMMLPATPPFDLAITFQGLIPSQDPLSASDTAIDDQTFRILTRLDLHGKRHAPQGYLGFTTTNPTAEVRVLLLAKQPVTQDADLPLPSKGSIVYLLTDGTWRSYPSIVDAARQRLHIYCDPSEPGRLTLYVTGIRRETRMTLMSPMDIH